MKKSFKVIFTIIGTVIGAGFASGQEIYSFFNIYGEQGFLGIILSDLLTGFIIYKILKKSNKYSIISYKHLLKNTNLPQNVINVFNIIVNIFLILSFYIMVAGFATYFKQEFNIPKIIMILITVLICYFTFKKKIEGITKINNIIIPILILIICVIGIKVNIMEEIQKIEIQNIQIKNNLSWMIKSIEYASYNSILLIPVLITLNKYIKNKKQITKISILSSVIIAIMSTLIFLLLTKVDVDIEKLEMPAVYVVSNMFYILKYLYGFVILGSIFTTTISLGMSFLQNTSKNEKSYSHIALIMCITSVVVSKIGFSNLVNLLYPVFGYLGLLQIYKILLKNAQQKR